jgi:hypothetical protein
MTHAALTVVAALALAPAAAFAQEPLPGRLELGFGVQRTGSLQLGGASANETTADGSAAPLFSTMTEASAAAGIEGRIGVRLVRGFQVEASASYSKPQLRATVVASPVEAFPTVTATETFDQFTIGGEVLWYLPGRARGARLKPFLTGGAAYLRHLHESATLVESGRQYVFGGGAKFLLVSRPASRLKGIGIRADARAVGRAKGVAFDDRVRYSPAVAASLFARF